MDLYERARALASLLEQKSCGAWASKFRDCLEAGSTGSEIVMCLRWNAEQFIGSKEGEDEDCRAMAALIHQEAARLIG